MKRIFALTLVALCLFVGGCKKESAQPNTDADKLLTGPGFVFGSDEERFMLGKDSEGRVVERVSVTSGERTEFEYGDDGVVIRTYDSGSVLVAENYCTPDKGTVYTVAYDGEEHIKYNYESGTLTDETVYKNNVPSVSVYYNSDGNQIKNVAYTTSGEVRAYTLYSYDEEGRSVRIETYSAEDKLTGATDYEYNEKGYYASITETDGDGKITRRTENSYDEKGAQTGKRVYKYENGVKKSYENWVADESGKLVLEGTYDA